MKLICTVAKKAQAGGKFLESMNPEIDPLALFLPRYISVSLFSTASHQPVHFPTGASEVDLGGAGGQGDIILSIIMYYPVESYRLKIHTDRIIRDNTG